MDYTLEKWEAVLDDGQWKIRLKGQQRGGGYWSPFILIAYTNHQDELIANQLADLHNANL